jgi:hypothetical protein
MNAPVNRRAALASIASAGALIVPTAAAMAAPVDPIFATIEHHRAAFDAWGDVLARQDILPDDELIRVEERSACLAEGETLMAIFVTGPATLDGARATLDYLSRLDEDDHVPNIAWMMRNSPLVAT